MTASPNPLTLDPFLSFDPLVDGEDRSAYEALRQHLLDDLQPEGALEVIWTDEIVALTWQRQQHARLRTHILASARRKVLSDIVAGHLNYGTEASKRMTALVERDERRDSDAVAHVDTLLAAKGHDRSTVVMRAHRSALPELATVEALTAALERRRERLLREFERHQAFAARVRAISHRYEHLSAGLCGEDDRLKRPPSAAEIARDVKAVRH